MSRVPNLQIKKSKRDETQKMNMTRKRNRNDLHGCEKEQKGRDEPQLQETEIKEQTFVKYSEMLSFRVF